MQDGATVAVADVDDARVRELVRTVGVDAIPVADAVSEPCDVLAPCALGSVVTPATIDALRCEIICGGANNQLESDAMDDALAARGILYAPDFVVNAGGILNIAEEIAWLLARARARVDGADRGDDRARVRARRGTGESRPGRAAERLARERIASEALPGGRWEPGDPAAWTNGEAADPAPPAAVST